MNRNAQTIYVYEVTEVIGAPGANPEVGSRLADDKHCWEDEPVRTWDFASMKTGEWTGSIVARYIGPREKCPKCGRHHIGKDKDATVACPEAKPGVAA